MSEIIKVGDVAKLLGCSVSTVWRWAQSGVIQPPFKIGGSSRWQRDEIIDLISEKASQREKPTRSMAKSSVEKRPRPLRSNSQPKNGKPKSNGRRGRLRSS